MSTSRSMIRLGLSAVMGLSSLPAYGQTAIRTVVARPVHGGGAAAVVSRGVPAGHPDALSPLSLGSGILPVLPGAGLPVPAAGLPAPNATPPGKAVGWPLLRGQDTISLSPVHSPIPRGPVAVAPAGKTPTAASTGGVPILRSVLKAARGRGIDRKNIGAFWKAALGEPFGDAVPEAGGELRSLLAEADDAGFASSLERLPAAPTKGVAAAKHLDTDSFPPGYRLAVRIAALLHDPGLPDRPKDPYAAPPAAERNAERILADWGITLSSRETALVKQLLFTQDMLTRVKNGTYSPELAARALTPVPSLAGKVGFSDMLDMHSELWRAIASSKRVSPISSEEAEEPKTRIERYFAERSPELSVPLAESLAAERNGPENRARARRLLAGARKSTSDKARDILASKREGPKVKTVIANKDTKTITEYSGAPGRVKTLETSGKVFRHWVQREDDLREILRTGLLKAGRTSYVEFIGESRAYIKNIYVDLQGVFFTQRHVSSAEPVVMNMSVPFYVDFILPEGVAALDMDNGMVLMIPGSFAPETLVPVEIVDSSLGHLSGA
ncbi:hypothetical protein ACFL2T_03760 [Elusimicrobiota bacterium]